MDRPTLVSRRAIAPAAMLAVAGCLPAAAAAGQMVQPAIYGGTPASARTLLKLAGHEGMRPDTLPAEHITRVVALGPRDGSGHIYSFVTAYSQFAPDELRSWRLKFLSGKLTEATYQIAGNTPGSITVTDVNGPLDQVAVGDPVLIDAVVIRDIPVR